MDNPNRIKAAAAILALAIALCAVVVLVSNRGGDERIIPAEPGSGAETAEHSKPATPDSQGGKTDAGREPDRAAGPGRQPEPAKAGTGEAAAPPAAAAGAISGRVTDQGGAPIAANVFSYVPGQEGVSETGCGKDGSYMLHIQDPAGAARVVVAEAAGYLAQVHGGVRPGSKGVDFTLVPAASIEGTVVLCVTGKPVPGAEVRVGKNLWPSFPWPSQREPMGYAARTGEKGEFKLQNLPPGRIGLIVNAEGFPETAANVDLAPGEKKEGVRIVIQAGVAIKGRVTDGDGLPLEGIDVLLLPWPEAFDPIRAAYTGADGTYAIQGVALGKYVVRALARKGVPISPDNDQKEVTIGEGDTEKTVDLCLKPGSKKFPCRVFGKVLRAGQPVDAIDVSFQLCTESESVDTATGEDGSYEIKDLPAGKYIVSIFMARFAVEVPQAAEFEQNFAMPTATAEGRVYDAATKKPVPGAWVSFAWIHPWTTMGGSMGRRTDKDGKYVIRELSGGKYSFHVHAEGYKRCEKDDIEILENRENKDIDLFISKGCSIAGVVFDPDGKRLAEADFCLVVSDPKSGFQSMNSAFLDEEGEFREESANPGVFNVHVCASGFAPCRAVGVKLAEGAEARLEFRLSRGGTIKIRAADSSGNPKSGVMFSLRYEDGETVSIAYEGTSVDQFKTDSDGSLAIERVPSGRITILCWDGRSSEPSKETVSVAEGGVVEKRYAVK